MVLSLLMSGCSAAGKAAYDNAAYDSEMTESATSSSQSSAPGESFKSDDYKSEEVADDAGSVDVEPSDRKIIRNASLEIQTEAYDETIEALNSLVAEHGGYVQDMSTSGRALYNTYQTRHASYVVRIPAEKLDDFLFEKDAIGAVVWSNVWQEDVTATYYDQSSRLTALRTKEERLLSILEKATELSDIIELENALSDTIYEIESITGSLNRLDNQINYSTVTIQIDEVTKVDTVYQPPKTLGEKISQEFNYAVEAIIDFTEDVVVTIVGNSPIIAIYAVVIIVVVIVIRKTIKKHRKKKADKKQQENKEDNQ